MATRSTLVGSAAVGAACVACCAPALFGIVALAGGVGAIGVVGLGLIGLAPVVLILAVAWRRRRRWRPVDQGTSPLLILDDIET